ncbi:MAG: hypothetical protein HQK75_05525 [Candidatus Magnetomorum sp.]|nr:hypothetical protein [Candidatus Magnetomorum sp.]
MKKLNPKLWLNFFLIIIYFLASCNLLLAIEPKPEQQESQSYQTKFNIVDRLARIEEGQKSIINEMKTRFETMQREMNQRFETMQREMNQRFETMQREMNQRFETMQREMNQRFESLSREMDRRFGAADKRIDQLGNYFIGMMSIFISVFLAIIGFAIWDRKTLLVKAKQEAEQKMSDHQKSEHLSFMNTQKKLEQVIDVMKRMSEKFPEMRSIMQTAQLT